MYSIKIEEGQVVGVAVGAVLDGYVAITEAEYLAYQESKIGSEYVIIDKKLVITPPSGRVEFDKLKFAKIGEINSRAQAYIDAATGAADTPSFEVQTWSMQSSEAKAWHADNNAPTPMLSIIAAQRGVPVDVLRAKAYAKVVAYEQIVAVVAGQRQKYEQQLDAAETLEDIQAIDVVYSKG